MARTKNEVLTIRTTAEVKALLKLAAEQERRSLANMIEVMIRHYCDQAGVQIAEADGGTNAGRAG